MSFPEPVLAIIIESLDWRELIEYGKVSTQFKRLTLAQIHKNLKVLEEECFEIWSYEDDSADVLIYEELSELAQNSKLIKNEASNFVALKHLFEHYEGEEEENKFCFLAD